MAKDPENEKNRGALPDPDESLIDDGTPPKDGVRPGPGGFGAVPDLRKQEISGSGGRYRITPKAGRELYDGQPNGGTARGYRFRTGPDDKG
jgi:hypothetical protein